MRLPDVMFSQNDSRVNNCASVFCSSRSGAGTIALVGHSSSDEKPDVDMHRALNATAVITAGSGICLSVPKSQVQVSWKGSDQNGVGFESGFCSSSVRSGSSSAGAMRCGDAASLPVAALGCPK